MLHANFHSYNNYVTDSLYQWDINQDLIIEGLNLSVAPEIHFSNARMGKAIVRQSTLESGIITVRIPNSLLQESLTIKAYIGIYEGDSFKVIESIEIPIVARERPDDYSFTTDEEEIYSFKALENKIDNVIQGDKKVLESVDHLIKTSVVPVYEVLLDNVSLGVGDTLDFDPEKYEYFIVTLTATTRRCEMILLKSKSNASDVITLTGSNELFIENGDNSYFMYFRAQIKLNYGSTTGHSIRVAQCSENPDDITTFDVAKICKLVGVTKDPADYVALNSKLNEVYDYIDEAIGGIENGSY